MTAINYRTAGVDGLNIFYREAGAPGAPKLLLLHGFPSASHMFRDLIPLLADRFHIVAPDLPGFGKSDAPQRATFDRLADAIDRFTDIIGFDRYAIYVFDYGAPTGFRLAVRHPDRITAIISQNGNAYEEGLSDGWSPIRAYWQDASPANREALRAFLKPETTVWQYTHGVPDATRVSPDGYSLDNFYLSRPGADELQLDLFGDYKSNVALYPAFQQYFRTHKPPLPGGVGQERSVLPAAGRRGLQARHPRRGRALLRHRPLRAGDPRRGDRGSHSRLPAPRLTRAANAPARRRCIPHPKCSNPEVNHMAALPLIVFDVNETLLDLETMEPVFQRIFGDKQGHAPLVRQFHHVFRGPHRGRLLRSVHRYRLGRDEDAGGYTRHQNR